MPYIVLGALLLLFISYYVLYSVIKSAINDSQATKMLVDIRKILLEQEIKKKAVDQDIPEVEYERDS